MVDLISRGKHEKVGDHDGEVGCPAEGHRDLGLVAVLQVVGLRQAHIAYKFYKNFKISMIQNKDGKLGYTRHLKRLTTSGNKI